MNLFKNRIITSCLLIVFLAFANNTFYGQTSDTTANNQIDNLFYGYDSTTPGVAVAVFKDGKIIFKKGYGSANLENDIPVTTKTVFQIASVSKQVTAFYLSKKSKHGSVIDTKFIYATSKSL